MKVLIVSDTHGKEGNLKEAIRREQPIDMLIHCGDVEGARENPADGRLSGSYGGGQQ